MSGWENEDWSMQLAAEGATELSMHDLNCGASEEVQEQKKEQQTKRHERVLKEIGGRKSAASLEELKEKNRKALEARKKAKDALLPAGWKRVESRSRPGEYVYENEFTEERQAWFPTEPAVVPAPAQEKKGLSDEQKEKKQKSFGSL